MFSRIVLNNFLISCTLQLFSVSEVCSIIENLTSFESFFSISGSISWRYLDSSSSFCSRQSMPFEFGVVPIFFASSVNFLFSAWSETTWALSWTIWDSRCSMYRFLRSLCSLALCLPCFLPFLLTITESKWSESSILLNYYYVTSKLR